MASDRSVLGLTGEDDARSRGPVAIKGLGEQETWWLEGEEPG